MREMHMGRIGLVFVAAALAIPLGWFLALPQLSAPPREATWIAGVYARKEAAARSAGLGKIVIIGGSGAHFSLSAEQISRDAGRPAVNLATHAGLGVSYLLHRARRSLERGDLAILAIEYPLLSDDNVSDILAGYVTFYDRSYAASAPIGHLVPLLFAVSPISVLKNYAIGMMPWPPAIYRNDSVNAYGDETANVPQNITEAMRQHVSASPPFGFQPGWADQQRRRVREFVEWARARGIRVFAVWPSTLHRGVYEAPPYTTMFAEFEREFAEIGVAGLGEPAEYMLSPEQMFDTSFHANSEGRAIVSRRLSRRLCDLTGC
jgi:hypothetical protein